ncbi:MAG TPA: 50S ribosomal protein L25 [Vicinamibacterales bacterium]|nr:50S ribosomal protein L25 [Vicinamibacterales bacterium]
MEATLEAVKRTDSGKNEARRHRAAGRLPAVVYGPSKDGKAPVGVSVTVDPKGLMRIFHSDSGVNTLITLKLDGTSTQVLVREYQRDPVTNALLHADFYQLAMDKAIVVTVPVSLKGEPKGVKLQGGLLDFVTREIQVECLPANIPEHIDVDVSDLELHQSIRVRDIVVGDAAKWKPVTEGDTMLVHVVMPKAEESAAATAEGAAPAAAAGTEPEVIKKGKGDKEEEGGDKDKKDKK